MDYSKRLHVRQGLQNLLDKYSGQIEREPPELAEIKRIVERARKEVEHEAEMSFKYKEVSHFNQIRGFLGVLVRQNVKQFDFDRPLVQVVLLVLVAFEDFDRHEFPSSKVLTLDYLPKCPFPQQVNNLVLVEFWRVDCGAHSGDEVSVLSVISIVENFVVGNFGQNSLGEEPRVKYKRRTALFVKRNKTHSHLV